MCYVLVLIQNLSQPEYINIGYQFVDNNNFVLLGVSQDSSRPKAWSKMLTSNFITLQTKRIPQSLITTRYYTYIL